MQMLYFNWIIYNKFCTHKHDGTFAPLYFIIISSSHTSSISIINISVMAQSMFASEESKRNIRLASILAK